MTTFQNKNRATPWTNAAPQTSLISKQAKSVVDLEQWQRAVDKAESQRYINNTLAQRRDEKRKRQQRSDGIQSIWGAAPAADIPFKHRRNTTKLQITPYSNIAVEAHEKSEKQDVRLLTVFAGHEAAAGRGFSFRHQKQGYVPDKDSDAIWSGALAKNGRRAPHAAERRSWGGSGGWNARNVSPALYVTNKHSTRVAQSPRLGNAFITDSISRSPSINIPSSLFPSFPPDEFHARANPLNAFDGIVECEKKHTIAEIANGRIGTAFEIPLPGIFDVSL